MSHRVELHASALAQIGGLPPPAFDALVTSLAKAADNPWDALTLAAEPPAFRQVVFGDHGLVSFYVDDDARVLRVFDITWTG